MNGPRASVIITVYEQAPTLRWLLESLGRQQSPSFEVLVCDDGSSSNMVAVVDEAGQEFGLDVRYIWQSHSRPRMSRCRNNGIRSAQGDVLIFLDGDMVVSPGFVKAHCSYHAGRSPKLACGARRKAVVDRRQSALPLASIWSVFERAPASRESQIQRAFINSAYPWMAMVSCNFSVPRKPEITFDENFVGWGSEDKEIALRLYHRYGYQVVYAAAADAVHITFEPNAPTINPLLTNDHDALIHFIRNKLYLRRLYPDVDLSPTLGLLKHLYYDSQANRWRSGPCRGDRDLSQIIALAERWMRSNGVEVPCEASRVSVSSDE